MNKLINDITGKPLTVGIYARPGFGKTALLIQMANLIADTGGKVCFISLEMYAERLIERCRKMGIDTENFCICDTACNIREMENFATGIKDLKVIVIDYLQLMSGKHATHLLSGLAQRMNVPVLISAQLSRAAEDNPDRRPLLKDIEHVEERYGETDVAITIWRPHECERDIDNARAYDIKPYTELEIWRSNCSCKRKMQTFL